MAASLDTFWKLSPRNLLINGLPLGHAPKKIRGCPLLKVLPFEDAQGRQVYAWSCPWAQNPRRFHALFQALVLEAFFQWRLISKIIRDSLKLSGDLARRFGQSLEVRIHLLVTTRLPQAVQFWSPPCRFRYPLLPCSWRSVWCSPHPISLPPETLHWRPLYSSPPSSDRLRMVLNPRAENRLDLQAAPLAQPSLLSRRSSCWCSLSAATSLYRSTLPGSAYST